MSEIGISIDNKVGDVFWGIYFKPILKFSDRNNLPGKYMLVSIREGESSYDKVLITARQRSSSNNDIYFYELARVGKNGKPSTSLKYRFRGSFIYNKLTNTVINNVVGKIALYNSYQEAFEKYESLIVNYVCNLETRRNRMTLRIYNLQHSIEAFRNEQT